MAVVQTDWANRWREGVHAGALRPAAGVRAADFAARPPLDRVLPLPADMPRAHVAHDQVRDAWSAYLGGARVLLVRSVERAREALLWAAGAWPGEVVAVPAGATAGLVHALAAFGVRPRFFDPGPDLVARADPGRLLGTRLAWVESLGGLPAAGSLPVGGVWVDHADTLPAPGRPSGAGATLWGLHLRDDANDAGALLAFDGSRDDPLAGAALHDAVVRQLAPRDLPDPAEAFAQLRRLQGRHGLPGLASRQRAAIEEVRRGIAEAAGLPLLPQMPSAGLPHHVAVRIPAESDAARFFAQVSAHGAPVRWLPTVQEGRASRRAAPTKDGADARWLLAPAGPGFTHEEIGETVFSLVQASERLGVRWRTDPARAAAYARELDARYGPSRAGYRPVFPTA